MSGRPTHHLMAVEDGKWLLNKKAYGDASNVESVRVLS
jgi:hypothetical protein